MRYFALSLLLILAACGQKPTTMEDFNTRDVTLANGKTIHVEVMLDATDMLRGMMFRTSLDPARGMLFIHRTPGTYGYWMYQTMIPLDIIWMDASKQVVEIVNSAPPCKTEASKCPHFGGTETAQFVLEIGSGLAKQNGIRIGDTITF